MGVQQKGASEIGSRNPLQLRVVDADKAENKAERALLDHLTPGGMLTREAVQKVLGALSASLQPKM